MNLLIRRWMNDLRHAPVVALVMLTAVGLTALAALSFVMGRYA